MARLLALLLLAVLFAGCVADNGARSGRGGQPFVAPREYLIANDDTVTIGAGNIWHYDFRTTGGAASYDFHLTDGSSVNIGFMRTRNVDNYAAGSTTNFYAGHSDVTWARDSTTLDADDWSLVIACRNSFADCDGILNRASFWT